MIEHNSKGNQLKLEDNGIWYKADYLGYESLVETLVSTLIAKSNVSSFVKYDFTKLSYKGKSHICCRSKSFKRDNELILTLPDLLLMYDGVDVDTIIDNPMISEEECFKIIVDSIERITDLDNVARYITCMIELDALFLNEDRHPNNIAVIYNSITKRFRLCPYFDFGASLFSDTKIAYDLGISIDECCANIKSKPISPSFDDQVVACRNLYGSQLKVYFTECDINECLSQFEGVYSEKILSRLKSVLDIQMKKYKDMFISGLDVALLQFNKI